MADQLLRKSVPPPQTIPLRYVPPDTGGDTKSSGGNGTVPGTDVPWHRLFLWLLGGIAMLALADPAPGIATALLMVIILGVFLNNWPIYATYLGIKK